MMTPSMTRPTRAPWSGRVPMRVRCMGDSGKVCAWTMVAIACI